MRKITLTFLILLFSFSIKEKMRYKIPIQCGKILYKKEVLDGRNNKSEITYETKKRFTVEWSDGSITEKYPTDNDYYHYSEGQRICYERPELLTGYERISEDGFFCFVLGIILFFFILFSFFDLFD